MNESEITVDESYKLIVTIVKKGAASKVVVASKEAGAKGGTILLGKGTADKDTYLDKIGFNFGLEKEVILTFVKEDSVDAVLEAIADKAKLDKPGYGIGFIVNIKGLTGISHLLKLQKT
jgi:nitrogen regulatory protein PII